MTDGFDFKGMKDALQLRIDLKDAKKYQVGAFDLDENSAINPNHHQPQSSNQPKKLDPKLQKLKKIDESNNWAKLIVIIIVVAIAALLAVIFST